MRARVLEFPRHGGAVTLNSYPAPDGTIRIFASRANGTNPRRQWIAEFTCRREDFDKERARILAWLEAFAIGCDP